MVKKWSSCFSEFQRRNRKRRTLNEAYEAYGRYAARRDKARKK
jgi:hypothetical protein